jgi:uncharacterized protein YggE
MKERTRVFLVAALATLLSGAACAGDEAGVRSVKVNGEGTVAAVPDTATVTTGVVTEAAEPEQALARNNEAVARLLAVLEDEGVPGRNVQTSGFSIYPQYARNRESDEPPRIVAYRVSNQLTARVEDLERVGPLLDALVRAGSNRVSGIEFGHSDLQALTDEARQRAVADARRRAGLYAEAAEARLGEVLRIVETQSFVPRPVMRAEAMMMDAAPPVPVAAGESEIRASVQVEFALE